MYMKIIILTICVWRAFSQTEAGDKLKEMDYLDGSIVENKYLLPSINISEHSEELTNHTNEKVSVGLSRALDFYNTQLLAANWNTIKIELSEDCAKDMQTYIDGLTAGATWALKMDDASGRYSTGWFWGNQFWTGSQSLCENVSPVKGVILANGSDENRLSNVTEPLQYESYKKLLMIHSQQPQFDLGYFVLRVNINNSFTSEERILHIGLCLPDVCTNEDARVLFEETSRISQKVSLKVGAIRSRHQRYNMFEDVTFLLLCTVTAGVIVLLISGTAFDVYIQQMRKKKKTLVINCTTYSPAGNDLSETVTKLDMGTSGFYMVSGKGDDNNNGRDQASSGTETPSDAGNKYREIKLNKQFILCLLRRLVLAFSIRVNVNNIFNQSVGSDTLSVIHGLKSISIAWVILGHTCLVAFKYSDNMEYRKVVHKEFMFQTILNATFSVDTFFFTSGLLVSFLYFRANAKGKLDHPITNKISGFWSGFLHFFGLIIYRFARLTAPYLFVIGVLEVTMKWFYYNSVFEPPTLDHVNCPNYWWRNLLYINTLFPVNEMCMLWSWYLSDDTQFYIVGAVLLILAVSHFKSAAALLLLFVLSSWMTTGFIAFSNSHLPGADDPLALFDKIYDKPWTRLGPYLIGMCVGWLLFKTKCELRMNKLTVIIGWFLSSIILLALVYGLHEINLSPLAGAAYSALSHSVWALGLAWIVVACTTGYGGYVNKLLSASVLYPFSRLTYCAYLLHPIALRVMVMSMDQPLHLGKGVMPVLFLGQVVASFVLAFAVSISFEGPSVSMLRILTKLTHSQEGSR
ncbi:hypothetical protein PPYR_04303 [Photinus pyralis]|uniref:Nose resistant-to-fluoxetine protein N-terminal domain-containing protein n=1 Tax=Photinus pyralis TaxID=7054 RepID=A0A5N4AXR8_PHOPY|nr:nose resistant to fluoxetine protein 6 isoform X2 [Photinus pyralis]KAB0802117.1 hypothetical protein PPYR_04303 [Photinus pyralis]